MKTAKDNHQTNETQNPMTKPSDQIAFIYCRVSSPKQVREGHGLDAQESRCREYAGYKGHEVLEVFREEGVSGELFDRPAMQAMLKRVSKFKSTQQPIVIIDDISRLARSIESHIQLRTAISGAGGRPESLHRVRREPDSILVENLLASVSQHQRQKRRAGGQPYARPRDERLLVFLADGRLSL